MKKLFTLIALATMLSSTGFGQTCDTLFNLVSVLDTPTVYLSDNSGYISGNNGYGDLAKAEGFTGIIGDSVKGALFYFAVATINSGDSNNTVVIGVWDNAGGSGAPGNLIDTAHTTLRKIAQTVTHNQLLQVNFTHHVALTTDTFYVGVILPTIGGDTLALVMNTVPPGPDGNGWELSSDATWYNYNDDWGFTDGSAGNYIVAYMCGSAVSTGISATDDAVSIKIFPNPAYNQLNFQWDTYHEADITMYGITGNILKSFTVQGAALNTFDIHDLPSGAYIIRVTDRQTNEQHSSLFTKL